MIVRAIPKKTESLDSLFEAIGTRRKAAQAQQTAKNSAAANLQKVRLFYKSKFFTGKEYTPSDIAEEAVQKRRSATALKEQRSYISSGIKLNQEYKNIAFMSSHVNHAGQLFNSKRTGLSRKEQMLLGKCVNRAVSFGIIPRTRKHWRINRTNEF